MRQIGTHLDFPGKNIFFSDTYILGSTRFPELRAFKFGKKPNYLFKMKIEKFKIAAKETQTIYGSKR
ncbi:MAG: hypothetical protein UW95_C0027G0008 [Parcubacteria group bacterium GW2011_GWC1_45_14]|nr:MAG: hypothetical protein UW87_C0018G0008 [Candidatus Moranbacteria bacterium GW2011_GWC2_45_10]KKT93002.1 MAG: hypothetical protein UW95_C0027G0008 [Parcubacteria group bacterium GW2011_GWC1_45_14]